MKKVNFFGPSPQNAGAVSFASATKAGQPICRKKETATGMKFQKGANT
ncbi:MAG: hypothetical protein KBC17_03645 [Candidatus Pacebacteria bacterium]|nr:hypothetical protein [Candidatus Paceibacterota bacterium]